MRSCSTTGQTLIELLITLSVVTLSVAGVGSLFKAEWERGKCAYVVFQTTRTALNGETGAHSPLRLEVQISESTDEMKGKAQCGASTETIAFKKLH